MSTTQVQFQKKTDAILLAREMCYQGGYGAVIYDSESELYYAENRPVRNRPACQKQVWQRKTKKGDPDFAKEDQPSQIDEGGQVFPESRSLVMSLRQLYAGQQYAARTQAQFLATAIYNVASVITKFDRPDIGKEIIDTANTAYVSREERAELAVKDADALIAAGRIEEPKPEADDGPKRYHGVGTRIYNRGGEHQIGHFGTITAVSDDKMVPDYTVTPDSVYGIKPYTVSAEDFSAEYHGHGGTQFVTQAAWHAWSALGPHRGGTT